MKQSLFSKPIGVAVIMIVLLAVGMLTVAPDVFQPWELTQLDGRFAYREENPKEFPKNVVLVELNNRSVHYSKRWPWSWDDLAKLIKKLRKAKPKAIGLEVPILYKPDLKELRQIYELVNAYRKLNPPLDAAAKKKMLRRLRYMSRRKREEYIKREKQRAALEKMFKKLIREDPRAALIKELKATPNLVLGFRYFRREQDVPGLDLRYIKKKMMAAKKKGKKAKKTASPKKNKVEKGMLTLKKFTYSLPVRLFRLGAPELLLGATEDPAPEAFGLLENPLLASQVRYHGFVNVVDSPSFVSDPTKILHKVPLFIKHNGATHPSLALATYIAAMGNEPQRVVNSEGYIELKVGDKYLPLSHKGEFWLNYYGTLDRLPAEQLFLGGDILSGRTSKGDDINSRVVLDIKDKIVLVGLSSSFTNRTYQTPFRKPLSALKIHATVLGNLVEQTTLFRTSSTKWIELGLLIFLGLLLGLAMMKLRIIGGFITIILMIALLEFVDRFYIFPTGTWLNLLYIYVSLFAIHLAISAVRTLTGDKIQLESQIRFQNRLAPEVMNQILVNPSLIQDEGVWRPVTCLTGVAEPIGSALNEELEAKSMARIISQFVHPMSSAILRNHGTLNYLTGHSFQALFNAPLDMSNHIEQACSTALQMKLDWDSFLGYWQQEDLPTPFFGIGLDTGPTIVGNVGNKKQFIYTAVGLPVERSELIQRLSQHYRCQILMSDTMYNALEERAQQFIIRELDWVRFDENQGAISIYELLGDREIVNIPRESVEMYMQGLNLYRSRQFQEAIPYFQEALRVNPNDGPAQIMLQRCQHYVHYPPSFQWDGAWKAS